MLKVYVAQPEISVVKKVKDDVLVLQQYVKAISSSGMQSHHGFEGQVNACWTHKMTRTEIESIRSAGFLVSVIHGRYISKHN